MSTRRKYTKEFKLDAISLVMEQGYPCPEAAKWALLHQDTIVIKNEPKQNQKMHLRIMDY